MALSIIGTPGAAHAASITLPTHAVGDLILIYAYRWGSTTVPAKPSPVGSVPAWVDIDAAAGANSNSSRTAYFVATVTNHTSGTWSNATDMAVIVYRGQAGSPIGGHAESGSTSTNTVTAPAVTLVNTDGTSALAHFFGTGQNMDEGWDAAPVNYTRRAAVYVTDSSGVCLNTKDSTTSDGSTNQTFVGDASNTGYRGATVEVVVAAAPPKPSSLFINQARNRASFY